MPTKEIMISRTEGEWSQLNQIAKNSGKGNLKTLMQGEIRNLAKRLRECEKCVSHADGEMVEKRFYLSEDSLYAIRWISLRMKKPIGAVLNDIIISQLLHKK